jgi:hypothetical protein
MHRMQLGFVSSHLTRRVLKIGSSSQSRLVHDRTNQEDRPYLQVKQPYLDWRTLLRVLGLLMGEFEDEMSEGIWYWQLRCCWRSACV